VINAAHNERELLPEVDGFAQSQAVPELMEHGSQHAIGFGLARQSAVVPQLLQPLLRLLYGMGYSGGNCHRLHSLGYVQGRIVGRATCSPYAFRQCRARAKRTNDTGWARGWI